MSTPQTSHNLDLLEKEIINAVRQFSSAELLLAINAVMKQRTGTEAQSNGNELYNLPFIAAALSSFAVRYSNPYRGNKKISLAALKRLSDLTFNYLGADPITHDEELAAEFRNSNPIFMMLRIVGNQFPFEVNTYAFVGQTLLLYGELPKEIESKREVPHFDFTAAFQKINGLSLENFICCGFVAWAAFSAKKNFGITREYFEKARSQGIKLPDDGGITYVLDCITADPIRFRQKYEEMKQRDRRFGMYDFNPLLTLPIVRPWPHYGTTSMLNDRIIAPLPNLIAYRISTGIFYEIFNSYKEDFSRYFGHLFEAYVGRLLKAFIKPQNLISEEMIKQNYPSFSGKVPDWVVLEGSTAILIECKATRFSLTALSTGAKESVDKSLTQVLKGLKQLSEFKNAITKKGSALERFNHCSVFMPVLVTFEPLYLINTVFFREHINNLLKLEGVSDLSWRILSIKELEAFQPHFNAGISLSDTLTALERASFHQVLNDYITKTGCTYKDSILYKYDEEMYKKMGLG